ncbi:unnamed protein product [Arabis nemorensis]|uniref:UBP-type domain-containing protein n=1 Tax=Arabis nemorensis TaxID=586526 RepID=A0A565BEV5_9BRAS|nr:unnamed protein product [Arabis nemorensis]
MARSQTLAHDPPLSYSSLFPISFPLSILSDSVSPASTMSPKSSSSDRYSVLITLSDQSAADGFHKNLNGKKYAPSEAEVCHILSVELTEFDELAVSTPAGFTEFILMSLLLPHLAHVLPHAHLFMCQQQDEILSCSICGKTENVWGMPCLWLLRYKGGHSIRHWKETHHCYSLDLRTPVVSHTKETVASVNGVRIRDLAEPSSTAKLIHLLGTQRQASGSSGLVEAEIVDGDGGVAVIIAGEEGSNDYGDVTVVDKMKQHEL